MITFTGEGDALEFRHGHEVLRVQPWGIDSVRVRAANGQLPDSDAGALERHPPVAPRAVATARLWDFERSCLLTHRHIHDCGCTRFTRVQGAQAGSDLCLDGR